MLQVWEGGGALEKESEQGKKWPWEGERWAEGQGWRNNDWIDFPKQA